MLANVHIYCFLLSYLAALLCEWGLVVRRQSRILRLAGNIFAAAGMIAHTAYLIARSQEAGLPPLLASQQDWVLVMAWLGGLVYLILRLTHRGIAQGLFMLPAVLFLIVVAIFVSDQGGGQLKELALRRWGLFHAASLVLGISAVIGACITGMMYLLHHQRLRNRHSWLQRLTLPSLENLTAWNRWMVVFSVPCLTIGMLTGFLLISWSGSDELTSDIPWTDPTILTTIVVWVAMTGLLFRLLSHSHPTGKAVAQLSLLSGAFLLITVLGPMLLANFGTLDTFHGRPRQGAPANSAPDTTHSDSDGMTPVNSSSPTEQGRKSP